MSQINKYRIGLTTLENDFAFIEGKVSSKQPDLT